MVTHRKVHLVYLLGILLWDVGVFTATKEEGSEAFCGGLKSCLKCDSGSGNRGMRGGARGLSGAPAAAVENSTDAEIPVVGRPRCVKCTHLIVLHSRECVDFCPPGYTEEWSSLVDYMGKVCKESLFLGGIALSGQTLAVAVGATVGTALCLVLILIVGICIKYRRYKALRNRARQSPSLGHLTGTHRSQDSDDSERPEFLKHLATLRGEAPIFLAMLNETRRQVRELRRPSRQDSAIQAYKPVLKDLSRILILLNRRDEKIDTPPADWETLLAWGERVLRRYKKQHPHQVAQLVNFLQVPTSSPPLPSPYPTTLTTFHSKHPSSPPMPPQRKDLQQLAISAFDDTYNSRLSNDDDDFAMLRRDEVAAMFLRQPPSLLDSGVDVSAAHGWESEQNNCTILAEWNANSQDYTPTEDDDFFQLGFRPQDEITTEL
ncbi:unnamed protein product [Bemisia tabaci]|uniref:Uncharacterized protein n=1 Tax=Bemisia tabaci TaxID=7038 RepID=A0A9P0G1P0_BEMTA|nr:PREDICTED: uncharacterized protein LOC109035797 [Bemisia tabaci]CAH0767780.1 unnamed protein product [Bemisia tabaci]